MRPHFCEGPMKGLSALLFLSLLLCPESVADTITLKNGKDLKGLVVEKHADRIILSTEKKELPILLKGIKNIQYDDPERSLLEVGKAYEQSGELAVALAYYEKALTINPGFEEAKAASQGVRNRFWAISTQGPKNEIEKQQLLYDAWGQGRSIDDLIRKKVVEETKALRDGLGIRLEKKGDWVRIGYVDSRKDAWVAGLRKNDRLVSIDGQSLRYLSVDLIQKSFLSPRYSNFTLEFERNIFLHGDGNKKSSTQLGFQLKLEYQGLVISRVKSESPANQSGLRDQDLLVAVNDESVRYLPIDKVSQLIQKTSHDRVVLSIRRSTLLARK